MDGTLTPLREEYEAVYSRYESLCKVLVEQLDTLLERDQVKLAVPTTWRVKTWDSIVEKADRHGLEISSIGNINDLSGIRIITLFMRDIPTVQQLIRETFDVIREEDTGSRLSVNQFGYGSVHFEVAVPDTWGKVPTLKVVEGLVAEIQVRTASQHAWAAASHVLQYKHEKDVPPPLRRSSYRIAALLETVDLEFERLLTEREQYVNTAVLGSAAILNVENLREVLNRELPDQNRIDDEQYSVVLAELQHFGVQSIGELRELLRTNMDALLTEERSHVAERREALSNGEEVPGTTVERTIKGVYFTHVGLVRQALRQQFGNDNVSSVIAHSP